MWGGEERGQKKMVRCIFSFPPSLPYNGKRGGHREELPVRYNRLATRAHSSRGRTGPPTPLHGRYAC